MSIAQFEHPHLTCTVETKDDQTSFIGTLFYSKFESGKLLGTSLGAVERQFQSICELIDCEGGMLRKGIIMLGYHNETLQGDVLLPDGEIIGSWEMEENDDTSHFTPDGFSEPAFSAPSAWLLQDAIASWLASGAMQLD